MKPLECGTVARRILCISLLVGSTAIGCGNRTDPTPISAASAQDSEKPLQVTSDRATVTSSNPAAPPVAARFVREIPWAGTGQWLKADTHVHTQFSDGNHSASEVVEKAVEFGCQVIAITDHADIDRRAGSPEYEQAIVRLRTKYPGRIILGGLEWNVPPWGGDEHATVLVPPGRQEWATLAEFKSRFDDYHRELHEQAVADAALAWLAARPSDDGTKPVVIYNHPCRKRASSIEIVADLLRWRSVNPLVIGIEGGPGHQRANPLGTYKYSAQLIDRWDPAVARVGDAWDLLLRFGHDVWGACATSDFHDANPADLHDFWPGQFSETWLYVPEATGAGVLRAFHAGSFFGVHGHIARTVELTVACAGLPRPAIAGEAIEVTLPCSATVAISLEIPPQDWQGKPNRIDAIELIAVTADGASVVSSRALRSGVGSISETLDVPSGGMVLRARGRRNVADGPSLMFYTNPIRISVR